MELLARIDRPSLREQTLLAHSRAVGELCARACRPAGLEALGSLAGLLHDAGKASGVFQDYLRSGDRSLRGKINHSACGARMAAERFNFEQNAPGLAAILVAAAVLGHHSGLPDCLSPRAEDTLHSRLYPEKDIGFAQAAGRFTAACAGWNTLETLFESAVAQVQTLMGKLAAFCATLPQRPGKNDQLTQLHFGLGLAERFLFSALVDADRYDAFLFSAGLTAPPEESRRPLWEKLRDRLESHVAGLQADAQKGSQAMRAARGAISAACRDFAQQGPGVYRLRVPTGGGKTFASLRFALHAAAQQDLRHIFYVAPFKTILEQNAKEIGDVLKQEDAILEHHSDVVFDNGQEEALQRYSLLTERWQSPLILTTMVQFLRTLFCGNVACARRFHALAGSVLLLDEVQAMPVKFVSLFNCALNFLAEICGCTVVLCTATQPKLGAVSIPVKFSAPCDMVRASLCENAVFCRTRVVDRSHLPPLAAPELAAFVAARAQEAGNALVILNTKTAARKLYRTLRQQPQGPQAYCLTTSLCPAHRLRLIGELRGKLQRHEPLIVVSTQLIEAGVDISFHCVVRSLAGLDSIAQAAGRCNRHGGESMGEVFIVRCADEVLKSLPDIREEQRAAAIVLEVYRRYPARFKNDLLSAAAIDEYYGVYYRNRALELDYPVKAGAAPPLYEDTTLLDLLSLNTTGRRAALEQKRELPPYMLIQPFATAGGLVEVIERGGVDVLVPYGEGREIIAALLSAQTQLRDLPLLLRRAQRYTVHLFAQEARALGEALQAVEGCGVNILAEGYYDRDEGVRATGA